MFICNECLEEGFTNSKSLITSFGRCEICEKSRSCNDIKSSDLVNKPKDGRSKPTFANINLLGKCTLDCGFCLGKDLRAEFDKYDFNKVHFDAWSNFDLFLSRIYAEGIQQIYITGQNTDPTCYKYIFELVDFLKKKGFFVGMRSNGMKPMIELFNSCTTNAGDAVSLTMLTLHKEKHQDMTGSYHLPHWHRLLTEINVPLRVAIVVTRDNANEVPELIKYISKYPNVAYIQLRRVSTVTRQLKFTPDVAAFEGLAAEIEAQFEKVSEYETAPSYAIHDKMVSLWRTVATTANSWNYFVNGIISDEYEIIRGYMDSKGVDRVVGL